MTPEQRRLFLDTLNEAPRGRDASASAARGRRTPAHRCVSRRRRHERARRGHAVAVLRGVPARGAAADIDKRLGGVIGDWLQHRVVSGDAGHVTPIPRSLQRKGPQPARQTAFLLIGLGRFDRLEPRRHRARRGKPGALRGGASVPLARHRRVGRARGHRIPRIHSPRSCAVSCGRAPPGSRRSRVSICTFSRAPTPRRVHARLRDFVSSAARRRAASAAARARSARAPARARAACRAPRISSLRWSRAAVRAKPGARRCSRAAAPRRSSPRARNSSRQRSTG